MSTTKATIADQSEPILDPIEAKQADSGNKDIIAVAPRSPTGIPLSPANSSSREDRITVVQVAESSNLPRSISTSAFLEILPPDLHHHLITDYLDWPAITSLRLAHSYFSHLITAQTLARLRTKIITGLLAAEAESGQTALPRRPFFRSNYHFHRHLALYGRYPTRLRCYGCLRMVRRPQFHQRMCTDGMAPGAKRAAGRMCKRCEVERGRVRWGHWERENEVDRRHVVRLDSFPTDGGARRGTKRWGRVFGSRDTEGEEDTEVGGGTSPSAADSQHPRRGEEPREEVGICAKCRRIRYLLWWGCPRCFESEERRLQQEDREHLTRVGSAVLGCMEKWSDFTEDFRVFRLDPRYRGRDRPKSRWRDLRFIGFGPWMKQNKEDWRKWRRRRAVKKAEQSETRPKSSAADGAGWIAQIRGGEDEPCVAIQARAESTAQATAQLPHLPRRHRAREIRCMSCWVPNLPRRRYGRHSMPYRFPLAREEWCELCREEHDRMQGLRELRKKQETGSRWSLDEGLGCLFD